MLEDKTRVTRPMTGDEYIESLRDGREIWIYGERVKDVTIHPAFCNPVRMVTSPDLINPNDVNLFNKKNGS